MDKDKQAKLASRSQYEINRHPDFSPRHFLIAERCYHRNFRRGN